MSALNKPVILTYHSISPGQSPLKISPSLFTEQMQWLKSHCRVASLAEVVTTLKARKNLPERTVVLTFDDGYQDLYSSAAPVFRRMGFDATVFLPSGYCNRTNGWPGQPKWVDEQPLLSWEQVGDLARQGIGFGAHSVTHRVLTELSSADAERELVESRSEIQVRTGQEVEFFCYPYGRWNPALREMVRRHYSGACSTAAGVVEPDTDPAVLPRADVHYLRNPRWFRSLFTKRFHSYLAMRRLIRRLRGQPEGHYPAPSSSV